MSVGDTKAKNALLHLAANQHSSEGVPASEFEEPSAALIHLQMLGWAVVRGEEGNLRLSITEEGYDAFQGLVVEGYAKPSRQSRLEIRNELVEEINRLNLKLKGLRMPLRNFIQPGPA